MAQRFGPAQQALALASRGEAKAALPLLREAISAGDAEASFVLGLWQLEGRFVPRDLGSACEMLGLASSSGYQPAARIFAGFLASGTGGPRDWPQAVALLEQWSARDSVAARQLALIEAMDLRDGDPASVPRPEPLCDQPMISTVRGLFSAHECSFLAELAQPRLRPAMIFHEGQKRFIEDPLRNSDAAGFPIVFESPFVHALNRRIAAVTGTDVRQGEPLQVLRYGPGQEYRPHLDAVPGLANQRALTVLVYLNDRYEGGETHFPECGVSFRGEAGDALIFRNVTEAGRPDPATRHAGLAVTSGTKLIASRWIRERPAAEGEGFGAHEAERPKP